MYMTISEYPNYGVDENGNVKNIKTGCILKAENHNGYKYVKLYSTEKNKTMLVHRLVAKTFLPNPLQLPEVNHKDENTTNNSVDNLEWCTSKYNANYGHHIEHCKTSLKNSGKSWLGRKHSENSKKKMSQAKSGCRLSEEQKKKISASLSGRPKDSLVCEKISKAKGWQIVMDETTVFNSLSKCGLYFGVHSSSIQSALKNHNGKYRGHSLRLTGGNSYGL